LERENDADIARGGRMQSTDGSKEKKTAVEVGSW
jgi:hypothetical protein